MYERERGSEHKRERRIKTAWMGEKEIKIMYMKLLVRLPLALALAVRKASHGPKCLRRKGIGDTNLFPRFIKLRRENGGVATRQDDFGGTNRGKD